jgi:hypothetical protein
MIGWKVQYADCGDSSKRVTSATSSRIWRFTEPTIFTMSAHFLTNFMRQSKIEASWTISAGYWRSIELGAIAYIIVNTERVSGLIEHPRL